VTTRHVSELDAKTARKYTVDPATLARVVAGENGDEDLTRNERRRQEVGMKRAAEALGRWHLVKAPSTLRCDRCQRELKKRASRAVRRALPSTTLCFACAEADPAIEISVACGPTGPPQTTLTEGGR
jgi:hypothetical protein